VGNTILASTSIQITHITSKRFINDILNYSRVKIQILHKSLETANLEVQDPVRLRLERLDSVMSFNTEAKSRSLAGTKRDEQTVQISVFTLQSTHTAVKLTTLQMTSHADRTAWRVTSRFIWLSQLASLTVDH